MPKLSVIRAGIEELPNGPPLVVAIAGGTTGIGSYIAKTLATTFALQGNKLRVYIIGRNATRAEAVLAEGQRISPNSEWRFVQATDLALISEVDRCCAEIIRQETDIPFHGGPARLDVLYMTHSYSPLKERSSYVTCIHHLFYQVSYGLTSATATKEGLDAFLSKVYYSRIRFIMQFIPLLTASPRQGHVISVYAGSFEEVSVTEEPPIGCPPDATYGVNSVRKHAVFMKTFIFEELANKHAGHLSLCHIYPGLVDGPAFSNPENPLWFKLAWRIMYPLAWLLYMTSPDVCGQVMLYLTTPRYPAQGTVEQGDQKVDVVRGTSGELGGGSYALGQRGDAGNKGKSFEKIRREGFSKKIWDHTMETLEHIEKKNVQAQ
jgi:NAD(P)-dependent dehydrogenase (short-subunit alcohol dehydrogenase family)